MELVAESFTGNGVGEVNSRLRILGSAEEECAPCENVTSPGKRLGTREGLWLATPRRCGDANCDLVNCPQEQSNGLEQEQINGDIPMCSFCEEGDTEAGDQQASAPACSSSSCGHSPGQSESGRMSLLHNLVHPGCQSCGNHADTSSATAGAHDSNNLNVTSAILHLVSDIFRGITIFVVAILIELHVVKSSVKADGVCALLVSGFIIVGALALFQKVFIVVCRGGAGL